MSTTAGFIGLGNMGKPMAANLAQAYPGLLVFDVAGTAERAVPGGVAAAGPGAIALGADVVFLSLPDGDAVQAVARSLAAAPGRRCTALVDLSTIGVEAARTIDAQLHDTGLRYLDAPVSGGTAGAKARTISMMCSGDRGLLEELRPLLEAISGNVFFVGETPGQGQALKLLNNFLSATALAATSEAIALGEAHGLDMKLMLDVLNVSSGQNSATRDKFPNRILTGRYDAGFTTTLLQKDLRLYRESVRAAGTPHATADAILETWLRFHAAEPGADFTRIYPFLTGRDA